MSDSLSHFDYIINISTNNDKFFSQISAGKIRRKKEKERQKKECSIRSRKSVSVSPTPIQ